MKSVALDELVTFSGGGTPSKSKPEYYLGSIPWVTPKDMKSWEITDAQDHISELAVRESATNLVQPGAVLLVVRSGVLKHSLPVGINRVPVAVNQDLKVLQCGQRLLAEYLARYLQFAAPKILTSVRATTVDNIPVDELRALQIPLCSLAEQRRIADILDKADAIRRKRKEAIALTEELLRATFLEMFGDPVANPKGWPVKTLDQLNAAFSYGTSTKCGSRGIGRAVLRIPNVAHGEIDLSDLKYADLSAIEAARFTVVDGDILFVRTNGNPHFIARSAVFTETEPMLFASYLIRARLPRDCAVLPQFVHTVFEHHGFRRQLLQAATTTAGNYNINTKGLGGQRIPMPPRELQKQHLQRVGDIRLTRTRQQQYSEDAEELFAALVERAFSREL